MSRLARWLANPINLATVAFTLAPFLLLLVYLDAVKANLPRGDDFARGMPVAIATIEGDLTLDKLLGSNIGQVAVFNKLVTATLTVLTDWNVNAEMGVTVGVATLGFFVLAYWIAQYHPTIAGGGVVVLSVLYFSIHQNTNWFISHNSWFWPQLLYLLTMVVILRSSVGWGTFVGAVALAVAATYSHGNGATVWPGLLPLLWWRGYRKPYYLLLWLLIGAVSVYGYAQLASVSVTTDAADATYTTTVNLGAVWQFTRFALGVLGSLFISHASAPAIRVGIFALVMLTANLVYLWRVRGDREAAVVWGTASLYSLGTALMIGMTRYATYDTGIDESLGSRYITATIFMWSAIVVSGMVIVTDATTRGAFARTFAAVNIMGGTLLAVLFAPSVYVTLGRPYYDEQKDITEECYMRALYIQDSVPLFAEGCKMLMGVHLINELSLYELALFADDTPRNIIGDAYTEGTPVLVEGDYGWVNFNVQKWLLDGVAADDLVNVTPELPESDYTYRTPTLANPLIAPTAEQVAEAVGTTDALWVIQRADMPTTLDDYWSKLADADYVPTTFTVMTDEGIAFNVTRYQRLELVTDNPIMFGDNIGMAGWTPLEGRLDACNAVTVRTFWQTPDGGLMDGFSATLSLDRITGEGVWDFETVTRADSQLTLTPTEDWQPDALYLDERTLDIPCDLPDGNYALRMGVYNYRDNVRLVPITDGVTFPPELNLATIERLER
jgi:hypothetical protein